MGARAVAAAIVILLAIGIALLIPLPQTCPPGETLTTTGWNEAAPRCYTKPIAQLEGGTPPLEQSRVDIQVIIVGAGLILAVVIIAIGEICSRSGSQGPHTKTLTGGTS
jgi:hypothetical protein